MKWNEAVRAIMEKEGVGLSALAGRMGKSMRLVWDRLDHDNLSVHKLDEMVRVLGYKIMIVPADTRVTDKTYTIE